MKKAVWQSKICFTTAIQTLLLMSGYQIGFLDDYSRYITSLGLYRSQTAAHVLETYRRGIAEYGVPREMLTDNGRQYTNWRGNAEQRGRVFILHSMSRMKTRPPGFSKESKN